MKKFFEEFKKFITRGNVMDMAVGVIVGGAFTAIVNGLSNNILKPIINWVLFLILGKDSLSAIHTILVPMDETGALIDNWKAHIDLIDLTQSIYIDWGAFINAVINFFLIAFVLFIIVKIFNEFRENQQELKSKLTKGKLTKAQRKELKKAGIKLRDKAAVKAYFEKKQQEAEQKAAEEKAAAEAAAKAEREANPTTEDLLKLILAELKKD